MYVGMTGFNVLYAIAVSLWYIIVPTPGEWVYILLLLVALGIGAGMGYIYLHHKNFIRIGFFIQLVMGFFAVLSSLHQWANWLVMTGTILNGLALMVDYFVIQRLDRSRLRRK